MQAQPDWGASAMPLDGLDVSAEHDPLALVVTPPDPIRAAAVRLFRQMADDLESGRLRGGRIQWRDGLAHVERVELDGHDHVARREGTDGAEEEALARDVRIERVDLTTGATAPLEE